MECQQVLSHTQILLYFTTDKVNKKQFDLLVFMLNDLSRASDAIQSAIENGFQDGSSSISTKKFKAQAAALCIQLQRFIDSTTEVTTQIIASFKANKRVQCKICNLSVLEGKLDEHKRRAHAGTEEEADATTTTSSSSSTTTTTTTTAGAATTTSTPHKFHFQRTISVALRDPKSK
jgi:hypothetical protein